MVMGNKFSLFLIEKNIWIIQKMITIGEGRTLGEARGKNRSSHIYF